MSDEVSDMEALQKYLNSVFPFTQKDRTVGRVLQPFEENYLRSIREYWEKHRKEEEQREGDILGTSIDNIFGLFLLEMDRELSLGGQKYIQ